MPTNCSNCGVAKSDGSRKLCWKCTNWKRTFGTMKEEDVARIKNVRRNLGKRKCVWCEKMSTQVVPGEYTVTGKPMCVGCSWAAGILKEALQDPVKMYGLKERMGL